MTSAPIEDALRWIAASKQFRPIDLLKHAINDLDSNAATLLGPLIGPTSSLPEAAAETRALAVWGLIIDTVNKVGPSSDSRRRNTLIAAFRLPRQPEVVEPWKATLGDRFSQLLALTAVFGDPPPTTTTPMHKAWRTALTDKLAPILQARLTTLAKDGALWQRYVDVAREVEEALEREQASRNGSLTRSPVYRSPSKSAQPVFLDLFLTTVFMKGRAVYRRITERLVTAQEDNVDGYTARALAGASTTRDLTAIPVSPLWGCVAERVPSRPGEPVLTRLRFPRSLYRGDKHYFSSEAIDEDLTEERLWVNVEVDHHGVAPGQLSHGCLPVRGLTIRIRFDDGHVPEACWWYAEMTERERRDRPPDGDPRLLLIVEGSVEHTFAEGCQPRENYGVALLWPEQDS